MTFEEMKKLYPDEWILVGDPVEDEYRQEFLSGVHLYHSPDKREICYLGRDLDKDYATSALVFNRVTPKLTNRTMLGTFCRIDATTLSATK